ncbi:MAG: hypothetical protein J5843_02075, partial [Clostridia bacterium]|nr:hypothetical protein [Clostridia bacterium]
YDIKDSLPADLDFGGRGFTFFIANSANQNDFMGGVGEETGEIVSDAVYRRNLNDEERLGVKLDYYADSSVNGSNTADEFTRLIMSGDSAYDVFTGYQYAITKLMNVGGMVRMEDLDRLDLEKPWWWKNYMKELTLRDDKHFFLIGDFFFHSLRMTRAMYYNKVLYGNYYDNPDGLYDFVLSGDWTFDKMIAYAKSVFIDYNNDGVTDSEDQLGFISWGKASCVDPFIYSADIDFCIHESAETVELNLINEKAVDHIERVKEFFYQEGSYSNVNSNDELYGPWKAGRVLFLGNGSLNTPTVLRDMECEFGILPYPKMDDKQENYITLVSEDACPCVVSVCSLNLDIAGTVLEALGAETYRTLLPVWYEEALKVKYSRDDLSSQMLDIIHDNLHTNFIYAFTGMLENIGFEFRTIVSENADYVSHMEKKVKIITKKLDKLNEMFDNDN